MDDNSHEKSRVLYFHSYSSQSLRRRFLLSVQNFGGSERIAISFQAVPYTVEKKINCQGRNIQTGYPIFQVKSKSTWPSLDKYLPVITHKCYSSLLPIPLREIQKEKCPSRDLTAFSDFRSLRGFLLLTVSFRTLALSLCIFVS